MIAAAALPALLGLLVMLCWHVCYSTRSVRQPAVSVAVGPDEVSERRVSVLPKTLMQANR